MQEYDILIIGGGPSGLSTALHLVKNFPHLTHRILILEKARYPRPKLCAGGLVIDAEIILQRLGLDVSEVPHVDADRIHFDFEAKGLNIRVPRRHALRVIRRDEFDNWLAKKAKIRGLQIREDVAVKNIIPQQDHVNVETHQEIFLAKVVVGADGSNGVTRRCIFPNAPVHTARVLEVLTPSQPAQSRTMRIWPPHSLFKSSDLREVSEGQGGQAYFDFSPIPNNIAGYVWDFPTQVHGEMMRCWGIYDTNLLANEKRPPLKELLAREMSRAGFDLEKYEIKGHPIRWFSPENQMAVPRVLLVGDAAGADPFLGEGISMALGYGVLAAREIGEAFQRNEFSFRGYKRQVLKSPLGQVLIARWIVAQIIYSLNWKWFQILVWRIVKPIVVLLAWLFILNWGKRMPSAYDVMFFKKPGVFNSRSSKYVK
jgi:flavin-dependent dehydrogenase